MAEPQLRYLTRTRSDSAIAGIPVSDLDQGLVLSYAEIMIDAMHNVSNEELVRKLSDLELSRMASLVPPPPRNVPVTLHAGEETRQIFMAEPQLTFLTRTRGETEIELVSASALHKGLVLSCAEIMIDAMHDVSDDDLARQFSALDWSGMTNGRAYAWECFAEELYNMPKQIWRLFPEMHMKCAMLNDERFASIAQRYNEKT
jgi:hypothetical protein